MTNSQASIFKKLSKKYNTPKKVQTYISSFKYNKKPTMRSAIETWRRQEAHCMEGAFLAAAILEPLGYPPLVLSFESIDLLEHVIFIYKKTIFGVRSDVRVIAASKGESLFSKAFTLLH